MIKEYQVKIEQVFLNYDPLELELWRKGDPSVVPERVLNWKGNGMPNGYGYGEFFVQKRLERDGHEVIANAFNIYAKKSKYKDNNERIERAMGNQRYMRLRDVLRKVYDNKNKIEQPDLVVLKPDIFFAEVKKDKDEIREPQILFALILQEVVGIKFKIFKLLPEGKTYDSSPIIANVSILSEYFG